MTSNEFIIWLKGFMEACNNYTATPKQWDRIKDELEKVKDIGLNETNTSFLNSVTTMYPYTLHKISEEKIF